MSKKTLLQQIPWRRKFSFDFFWFLLRYQALGNALLTLAFLILYVPLVYHTLPQPDLLTRWFFSQDPEAVTVLWQVYFYLLWAKASWYFWKLRFAHKNVVCREDHLRAKYWSTFAAVLLFYWMCFRIDFLLGAWASCYFRRRILWRVPPPRPCLMEGREIVTPQQAKAFYTLCRKDGEEGYLFGGCRIPAANCVRNFLWAGAAGSGKSLSMKLLMQDVLPRITPGSGQRALINDAAQEILSDLAGMGVEAPLYILNPFDARAYAWNLSVDFVDPDAIEALGAILIPQLPQQRENFFDDAAREFLKAIVKVFNQTAPGRWQLRDLIHALFSRETLYTLLKNEKLQYTLELLGGDEKGAENQKAGVMGTIVTKLGKFTTIAALMDYHARQGRTISLHDWANSESILVLGNSSLADVPMRLLNQVLFHRTCEILLDLPTTRKPENWIFLDELPALNYQPKLTKLALEGRKRGVVLVLGFQSKASIDRIYGYQGSEEILGQIEHKAVLRLSDTVTASWAANLFGRQVVNSGGYTKSA